MHEFFGNNSSVSTFIVADLNDEWCHDVDDVDQSDAVALVLVVNASKLKMVLL